ncbi:GntR family transcriptional regulator [Catenulispora rubra]|uniref:GntR family transcriptional regulator n=1 Tax=Catenulispora rubra TaxID=280293 RepID=UPI0018926FFF|nr:GntR family transcriptional regulator [Catenulispora rubra]
MTRPLLYETIVDHLLDELRAGELVPGGRVPSETELAAAFGVSRVTAKSALEVLRQAGIVERLRGKGSFVVPAPPALDGVTSRDLAERAEDEPAPAADAASRSRGRSRNRKPDGDLDQAIAFLLPDFSESYGLDLLTSVEQACSEAGIDLVLRRTRGSQREEELAIERLRAAGTVDGLLVFPVHGEFHNASLLRLVLDGFPLVLVDRSLDGIAASTVHTDGVAAAQALTEALIRRGHTEICFASPAPSHTSTIEQRLDGFRRALATHKLGPDAHRLTDLVSTLPGALTTENIRHDVAEVRRFLDAAPQVTAFVASEYNLARVIALAVAEQNTDRRATGDQAALPEIACFDSPVDPFAPPRFLHVRQDQAEMGRRAVELLRAQLAGETTPVRALVPFTVVEP